MRRGGRKAGRVEGRRHVKGGGDRTGEEGEKMN
jgi:hypothetical protein